MQGAARFERDVLTHQPDLIMIDYALNDRQLSVQEAESAWRSMIEQAQARDIPLILLTPSWDLTWVDQGEEWRALKLRSSMVRRLAEAYGLGLADSDQAFAKALDASESLNNLLSHWNHPSPAGHQLIAKEIAAWFPPR